MKLAGLRGWGNMAHPSAVRSVFPWCGRARLRVGPGDLGAPPLEPRGSNVLGARLLEFVLKEVPTPAAQCRGNRWKRFTIVLPGWTSTRSRLWRVFAGNLAGRSSANAG